MELGDLAFSERDNAYAMEDALLMEGGNVLKVAREAIKAKR
jgi:hypothetical protein